MDRYELKEVLGVGGMGTVYRAFQTDLQREVAIKVLHRDRTSVPGYKERFLREARLASRLKHPGVVPVLDFGQTDSAIYIAYELVHGIDLRKHLSGGRVLPADEIEALFVPLIDALEHLHAEGIVHRDLKPDNVLLRDGQPLITDLGIARHHDDGALTAQNVVLGTPAYMAPEQVRGLAPAPSMDHYSLAILLYECLTGRCPFVSENSLVVLTAQLKVAPPEPSRFGAPRSWDGFMSRALAKEVADRFPTLAAFREELLRLTAASAGGTTRLASPSRIVTAPASPAVASPGRHAWRPLAGGLLALALGLVIGVTTRPRSPGSGANPAPSTSAARTSSPLRSRLLEPMAHRWRQGTPRPLRIEAGVAGKSPPRETLMFMKVLETRGLDWDPANALLYHVLIREIPGGTDPDLVVRVRGVEPGTELIACGEAREAEPGGGKELTFRIPGRRLRPGIEFFRLSPVPPDPGVIQITCRLDPEPELPSEPATRRVDRVTPAERLQVWEKFETGQFARAQDACRQLLAREPHDNGANDLLICTYLNQALWANPAQTSIAGMNEFAQAQAGPDGLTDWEDLLSASIHRSSLMLISNPHDARGWAYLGWALAQAGDPGSARAALEAACLVEPDSMVGWHRHGTVMDVTLRDRPGSLSPAELGVIREILTAVLEFPREDREAISMKRASQDRIDKVDALLDRRPG